MIYKYLVRHRISLASYCVLKIKEIVQNLSWHIVKPIETDLKFCFVVGCGHSGTTLMAAKLGMGQECFLLGRETGNFLPGHGIYTSKAVAQEWEYFAKIMNKSCVVEKTPKHVHTAKRIKTILPNAKFIVMVRNPLDTCFSISSRFYRHDLSFPIERWNMDNEAAVKVKELYPEDTLIIRYEDLTNRPVETLKAAFDFVDITWDDKVLASGKTAYNQVLKKGNMTLRAEQTSKAIRPNNGKWREKFDQVQENKIIKQTWNIAQKLGYTKELMLSYLQKKE